MTQTIIKDAKKIGAKKRVLDAFKTIDQDVDRRNLKEIILNVILLQEEVYSLEERKLEEKVHEYEKNMVQRAKALDYFDGKKHDEARVKSCETYESCWMLLGTMTKMFPWMKHIYFAFCENDSVSHLRIID